VRIPHDPYKGVSTAVATFGVTATLVTSAKTSDKIVRTVIKSVFDNFPDFQFEHPALFRLNPEEMVKAKHTAPTHPGALSYFKSVNYSPQIDHVKRARH